MLRNELAIRLAIRLAIMKARHCDPDLVEGEAISTIFPFAFVRLWWKRSRELPYILSPLKGKGNACPERSRRGEGDVERSQRP